MATTQGKTKVNGVEEKEGSYIKKIKRFLLFFPVGYWEKESEKHIGNDIVIETTRQIRNVYLNGKLFAPINCPECQKALLHKELQGLAEEIKQMPTICGVCEKTGVNTFGECRCSYDESKYIKKDKILQIIKGRMK